jgi:hypothetical protein
MNDDEAPTPKESGSLQIFASTCEEAIEKLRGDDSDRANDLRHAARELLVELKTWSTTPPHPMKRSEVIAKVLDIHRAVSEYRAQLA